MTDRTVLISGGGIAGPALAFWLAAAGFRPTLIEQAPELRTGGYVIDFWGLGYWIAERMGLEADINRVGYHVREMRIVNDNGKCVAGFGTDVFGELTNGRLFGKEEGRGGVPDGMRVDKKGNLFVTGPGGIWIWDPDGNHIGTIILPESPANLNWGDRDHRTLYITARTSVYRLKTKTRGFVPDPNPKHK